MNSDETNKRNKRTKKELYKEERERLITTLNGLMGMDEKNILIKEEFDNNIELKEYLKKNIETIRLYYKSSSWGYFTSEHHNREKHELSLLRAIYKDSGYKIITNSKILIINNIKKKYTLMHFHKIN